MRVFNSKSTKSLKILAGFFLTLVFAGQLAAQETNVQANIKPVGQLCLAGEPCVGKSSGSSASAAAAAAPVAAPVAPAAAPAAAVSAASSNPAAAVAAPAAESFDVAAAYQRSCFACHSSGAAGAPVTGDSDAWTERMAKGMETVMTNVVNGLNAMPAKGLCIDCSNENLQALVDFMINQ